MFVINSKSDIFSEMEVKSSKDVRNTIIKIGIINAYFIKITMII